MLLKVIQTAFNVNRGFLLLGFHAVMLVDIVFATVLIYVHGCLQTRKNARINMNNEKNISMILWD